jgi:hypothetical protein
MMAVEDPVTTLARLIKTNMWLVKDDGSLASIHVGKEWYNRELLKNYEGQVTVGLARSDDQKLGFSTKVRRRLGILRVNIWVIDKQGMVGRDMRELLREEVLRIIRENRTKPNQTLYDFVGVGPPTGTHKAYYAGSASELAPGDAGWTELSASDYEKVWRSDDDRYSYSQSVNGEYSMVLFRFKIESKEETVNKIVLRVEGYGTAPAGNGMTIKVWNFETSAWEQAQTGAGGADEWISVTLESNLIDYIDSDGYIYFLARTTNPSDGTTAAIIYSDCADCIITVNGITYCDIISYRDEDEVRVKPFLWHTEFLVKSWLFENIPF